MRADHTGDRVVDIRSRRAGRSARWGSSVAVGSVDAGSVHGRPGVLLEGDLDAFADVQP
jgi:hypothetical protein